VDYVRPQWWGASIINDDAYSTGNDLAIHSAIRAFPKVLFIKGYYRTKGITIDVVNTPGPLKLIGEGLDCNFTLDSSVPSGTCLKFIGLTAATPQIFNTAIDDVHVSNLSFSGSNYTSIGIDCSALIRATFDNIRSTGHKYGMKLRNCISTTFTGIINLSDNVVGLKVPVYNTTGATIDTYNFGINVTSFDFLDARHNDKACISLGVGQVFTVKTMLGESTPVTMYLMDYCAGVTIQNVYLEDNTTPSAGNYAVKDRFGTYQFWLIYMGMDEDGTVATSGGNQNINVDNVYENNGRFWYRFWKCDYANVMHTPARMTIEVAEGCKNINVPSLSGERTNRTIIPGVGRSTTQRIALQSGYNLVANGLHTFPNLCGNESAGNLAVTRTIRTLDDGKSANVTRLTLPVGVSPAIHYIRLPRTKYGDYDDPGVMVIIAEAHVQASNARVTDVHLELTDHAGTQTGIVSLTSHSNPSLTSTDWNVLTVKGNTALNESQAGSYLKIHAIRTDTSQEDYLYVQEIIARDSRASHIVTPSTFDVLAGLCYRGTTSVSDAGRYYVQFTVPEGLCYIPYYEVIATAYGTVNEGVTVVKDNQYFRVYTNSTGIAIVAQLIPLQAISA